MTLSPIGSRFNSNTPPPGLPQPYAQWYPAVMQAAQQTGISPALLFGIMARETGGQNIDGDHGHGRGLFQIDDRSFGAWLATNDWGKDPKSAALFAANLLKENIRKFGGDVRAGVAAYNCGPGNVDPRNPDARTANGNYSADVMAKAAQFARYLGTAAMGVASGVGASLFGSSNGSGGLGGLMQRLLNDNNLLTDLADEPQQQWAETLKANGYGSVSERDIEDLYANPAVKEMVARIRRERLFHTDVFQGAGPSKASVRLGA